MDIRIVSATHQNLEEMVAEGRFRDDLYYRLSVYPIRLPPLRERKADIPALVEHFMERKAHEMGLHSVPVLGKGAIDRLLGYDWPGNVREVANIVERALIQSDGKTVFFEDVLSPSFRLGAASGFPGDATVSRPQRATSDYPAHLKLEDIEAHHIRHVMELTGGRIEGKNGAALLLGMNPATLRYRMQKLRIPFGRRRGRGNEDAG